MIRLFVIFLMVFGFSVSGYSQAVYNVEYSSQADVKVYVVEYQSQADLLVYKVDYKSQADGNKGYGFSQITLAKLIKLFFLQITLLRPI